MYNFIKGGYVMKRSVRELSEREREEILELGMNKKRGEINLTWSEIADMYNLVDITDEFRKDPLGDLNRYVIKNNMEG